MIQVQTEEFIKEKALIEAHIISLMQLVDSELFKYRELFNKLLEEKCHSE